MIIGTTELMFTIALWSIATIAYFLNAPFKLTAIAFAVCMTVSAIITPADMFSCILVGATLFVAYMVGLRIGSIRACSPA